MAKPTLVALKLIPRNMLRFDVQAALDETAGNGRCRDIPSIVCKRHVILDGKVPSKYRCIDEE